VCIAVPMLNGFLRILKTRSGAFWAALKAASQTLRARPGAEMRRSEPLETVCALRAEFSASGNPAADLDPAFQ